MASTITGLNTGTVMQQQGAGGRGEMYGIWFI